MSNAVSLTATQPTVGDFLLASQTELIAVASGSTASAGVNLASLNSFNGTVNLSCAPSSSQFSCSVNPTSTALSGAATATLTITATIPGATAKLLPIHGQERDWFGAGTTLALCFLFVFPLRRRRWAGMMLLPILLLVFAVTGCGGSGGGGGGGTNPPPANGTPAGSYSVVVSGTSNGIVHNALITVVVH